MQVPVGYSQLEARDALLSLSPWCKWLIGKNGLLKNENEVEYIPPTERSGPIIDAMMRMIRCASNSHHFPPDYTELREKIGLLAEANTGERWGQLNAYVQQILNPQAELYASELWLAGSMSVPAHMANAGRTHSKLRRKLYKQMHDGPEKTRLAVYELVNTFLPRTKIVKSVCKKLQKVISSIEEVGSELSAEQVARLRNRLDVYVQQSSENPDVNGLYTRIRAQLPDVEGWKVLPETRIGVASNSVQGSFSPEPRAQLVTALKIIDHILIYQKEVGPNLAKALAKVWDQVTPESILETFSSFDNPDLCVQNRLGKLARFIYAIRDVPMNMENHQQRVEALATAAGTWRELKPTLSKDLGDLLITLPIKQDLLDLI